MRNDVPVISAPVQPQSRAIDRRRLLRALRTYAEAMRAIDEGRALLAILAQQQAEATESIRQAEIKRRWAEREVLGSNSEAVPVLPGTGRKLGTMPTLRGGRKS